MIFVISSRVKKGKSEIVLLHLRRLDSDRSVGQIFCEGKSDYYQAQITKPKTPPKTLEKIRTKNSPCESFLRHFIQSYNYKKDKYIYK